MLKQKIEEDLKESLKNRDSIKVSTLRLLKSAIKNSEIEKKQELGDDDIISAIRRQIKQRQDSIQEFEKGARRDLVDKETLELNILKGYLPKQLDAGQIASIVQESIKETNASTIKDMGVVMKAVMEKTRSSADGRLVSELVRQELSKSAGTVKGEDTQADKR